MIMELSNCCDSPKWREESDICSKCKEHTDFYDPDEEILNEKPDSKESELDHYIDKD